MNIPGLGVGLKTFLAVNAPADLASVLCALAEASLPVAHLIRRGSLGGALDAAVGPAHDGVAQKALDVFADKAFVDGLNGSGVRGVVSEERDGPVAIDRDGTLLVAIDPLDGSSNIDANVTIGTVFSVLDAPAGEVEGAQFLQRGVTPAGGRPRGLRAACRLRLHHRGRRPHCDARSRYKRISGLGRRRQDCGGVRTSLRSTQQTLAIGPHRCSAISRIFSKATKGRAGATSTRAGSARWSPTSTAS